MMVKFILPLLLVSGSLFFLAASPVMAKDDCGKQLQSTCTVCHTLEAPCERLGRPLAEWKELLGRMRINGAELSSADVTPLAACLSQPSAAVKAVCGK